MAMDNIKTIVELSHQAFLEWRKTSFSTRAKCMQKAGSLLLQNKQKYADLITEEMGKTNASSIAEIEKCAYTCQYFVEHAQKFLEEKEIKTKLGQGLVSYQPLGIVLAIMPWNFPFWQVFRFAAPNLMAGNAGLLKHAPNTTGCGLEIEKIFQDSGFPEHLFRTLLVDEQNIEPIIQHPHIIGVSLTGSPRAGSIVAAQAGKALKKVVLELGGSDAYLILEDADLEHASECIVKARMQVSGQSCISPKRILAVSAIREAFEKSVLNALKPYGLAGSEMPLAPLARADLREQLHHQVQASIAKGAILLQGGMIPEGPGFYYPPTVLANVQKGMPAYDQELFGPVITLIDVKNEAEAISIANDTIYGLGGGVFTRDLARGQMIATQELLVGSCFVNNVVQSDPSLPFGGIKHSGIGRELAEEGIQEFLNIKTMVIQG
jgi:succinate-semialdehyde dehydrogenase/glutarate-semialdehyde dehydrogenase